MPAEQPAEQDSSHQYKKGFFWQDNLIGSAANSPKEAATTVNANVLTVITGTNDSLMLHLDPVKNIDADRFE